MNNDNVFGLHLVEDVQWVFLQVEPGIVEPQSPVERQYRTSLPL